MSLMPNTKTAATSHKTTNPAHAMVAGYLAGSSGTIVGYPLDSLKVWVQTNTLGKNQHLDSNVQKKKNNTTPGPNRSKDTTTTCKRKKFSASGSKVSSGARRSNSTTAVYNSKVAFSSSSSSSSHSIPRTATAVAGRYIVKPAITVARTIRALYSGVTGPLVTVGMVQSVNFASYDATRQFLYKRQNPNSVGREYITHDSIRNVAMSGSVGGMATALMTAPLLMMKINQQITGNSFRKAFKEIFVRINTDGSKSVRPLRPYGAAFLPHAASESVGRAIYVSTYEGSKRYIMQNNNYASPKELSLRQRMVCAATSGIVCWATFFPLDALRNRMYHATSRGEKISILQTIRAMRAERAFYRGFSISILRAGPVAASVLPVYDLTLEWLSK